MVKRCVYGTCRSDTRYPKILEGGVVFFPFTKPKTQKGRCRRWIKQCGRPHSQLNLENITKHMSAPRALDDIEDSIKELQFYRAIIFKGQMEEKQPKIVKNGDYNKIA